MNREIVNKKARERYYDNLEYARDYYKNNKEVILERNKKWIENNKEYFKKLNTENTKKWLKENPHVVVWRQIKHMFNKLKSFNFPKMFKTSKTPVRRYFCSIWDKFSFVQHFCFV